MGEYVNLELSEFETKVVEHILRSQPPAKHAARSALRHLERAWKLADDMPELAVFCGITAEEESATSVFHVLKRRHYLGANLLKPRDHVHKTALHPFLLAVGKLFAVAQARLDPRLVFDNALSPSGKELLRIRVAVPNAESAVGWAYPLPPLEFITEVNDEVHDFQSELAQLASEKNAKFALAYVKKLANRRNQALYAASNGIPRVDHSPIAFLTYRKSVVFNHLIAFLLIDPYPERQAFVQQALNAFLKLLQLIPDDGNKKS